jgi:hypothetical protein
MRREEKQKLESNNYFLFYFLLAFQQFGLNLKREMREKKPREEIKK